MTNLEIINPLICALSEDDFVKFELSAKSNWKWKINYFFWSFLLKVAHILVCQNPSFISTDRNFEVIFLNRPKLSSRIQLLNLKPLFTFKVEYLHHVTWIIVYLHKKEIKNGVPGCHMMDINWTVNVFLWFFLIWIWPEWLTMIDS